MTKKQFMEELRDSLEGMVSPMVMQDNLNYYENYIDDQMRKGRTQQEIFDELGNPRLIARSIIDAKGEDEYQEQFYEEEPVDDGEDMFQENSHIFTMSSTRFKIGCLLSVVILIFILYLLFHLFSAMMVFLGPVILIGVIVFLIMNITGR